MKDNHILLIVVAIACFVLSITLGTLNNKKEIERIPDKEIIIPEVSLFDMELSGDYKNSLELGEDYKNSLELTICGER